MKRLAVALVTLTVCGALMACGEKAQRTSAQASGTLALSSDDALLYAVDADNELVAVIDARSNEVATKVSVGKYPDRILLDSQDTAYVVNRGDRTVAKFKRDVWEVVKIPVGVEPVGLALSPDEKTLYVVNAASLTSTEAGSLMAIDTSSHQVKWDMDLPPEPRSIALLDEGKRAVISLFRDGDLVEVDLGAQKITRESTQLRTQLNRQPLNGTAPRPDGSMPATVAPRGLSQVVVSPDGNRIYTTGTLASDAVLDATSTDPNFPSGGSTYGGGSSCGKGGGSVAAPSVLTFDARGVTPQVDAVQECFQTEARDTPPTLLTTEDGTPIQGPVAMLVDPTGSWLYVANYESNNVAIIPTSRGGQTTHTGFNDFGMVQQTVRALVPVGSGPRGLAMSSDGRKLYVHNTFDHSVQLITSSGSGEGAIFSATPVVKYAEDVLPADVVEGRKLFFSASNPVMNSPTVGISCGSCHLEGREDGHVWNFSMGPRQTPSLAGRMLSQTAPFHWGGEHVDFQAFVDHTVGERMGGAGLTDAQRQKLLAFIDAIPAADNPHRLASPSEAQVRGAQIFQQADCARCHAGQTLTNNTNADVGTYVVTGDVQDDPAFFSTTGGLNTPSLLGLARTAPYLHDGSAQTLKQRILTNKSLDKHGLTSQLTEAQVDDLVEYLKAL